MKNIKSFTSRHRIYLQNSHVPGRMICALLAAALLAGCDDGSSSNSNNASPGCGNSVVDDGERCDGTDLNGKTCESLGYLGGTLSCNKSCEFNESGCYQCTTSDTRKCATGQKCSEGHCVNPNHQVFCGDNIAEGSESCDGTDLKGKVCADYIGYVDGELKCTNCSIDVTNCYECTGDEHCSERDDGRTSCKSHVCVKPGSTGEPEDPEIPQGPYAPPVVVISQVYPGGSTSGSIYKAKYIELFNQGSVAADISNWSIQYSSAASATMTSLCPIPANTKIPAHSFYLVAVKTSDSGINDIPEADFTCSSNISASSEKGKFFLVKSNTKLASGTPESGYEDGVGYGEANWAEGDAPVEKLNSKLAAVRRNECVDTDDNAADFQVKAPNPRNSKSLPRVCICHNEDDCGNPRYTCESDRCVPTQHVVTDIDTEGINCPSGFITVQNITNVEYEGCEYFNSIDDITDITDEDKYACIPGKISGRTCRKVPAESSNPMIGSQQQQYCTKEQVNPSGDTLRVHIIDVGQGDAIWIQTPNGKNVLIDSGEAGAFGTAAGPIVTDYLSFHGFSAGSVFDAVISTHPHSDHFGGFNNIFNKSNTATSYTLANYLDPMDLEPEPTVPVAYTQWISRMQTHITNSSNIYMPAKEKFRPGDSLPADFFGTGVETKYITSNNTYKSNNANMASIIFKLTYAGVSFIFTGDAEMAQEATAIQTGVSLRAQFLKVGHHGSLTSSSQEFLDAVWGSVPKSERYAIISSGRKVYSGTYIPSESVVLRLLNMVNEDHLFSTSVGDDDKVESETYRDDNILIVVKPDGSYYTCYSGTN